MSADHLVTVEIDCALEPVQLPLAEAIIRVWETLSSLNLGEDQLKDFRVYLGLGAEQRVLGEITRAGGTDVRYFLLDGELRSVQISLAPVWTAAR
jgi:hypothetical protein